MADDESPPVEMTDEEARLCVEHIVDLVRRHRRAGRAIWRSVHRLCQQEGPTALGFGCRVSTIPGESRWLDCIQEIGGLTKHERAHLERVIGADYIHLFLPRGNGRARAARLIRQLAEDHGVELGDGFAKEMAVAFDDGVTCADIESILEQNARELAGGDGDYEWPSIF